MVETMFIDDYQGKPCQLWFIKKNGLTIWSTFVKEIAMKKIQQVGEKKDDIRESK
jgi:hypothetical protein